MMLVTLKPRAFNERTADSRPGPGPLMRTSTDFTPYSCAARPAFSAATCAANGVDLREPRKPAPPEVAHDSALPWRSVIVTMVLLNEAWTCATPSVTTRLIFFFVFAAAAGLAMVWVPYFLMALPTSRRRSPSTTYLPTSARRRSTSGSDRSRILMFEATPAAVQTFFER